MNLTSTFSGVPLTIAFITMMGTSGVLVLLGKQLGISLLAFILGVLSPGDPAEFVLNQDGLYAQRRTARSDARRTWFE